MRKMYTNMMIGNAKNTMAVRTTVSWYLWTHQLIEVTGKDAAPFLDLIFANPIATLKVGRERYTTMLNEQAEIIDDVVVIRLKEEKFWISTLFAANMLAWMAQHKKDFCVEMEDATKQYHMYAVQGPNSQALVNALVRNAIDELKFFSICDNWIEDVPVLPVRNLAMKSIFRRISVSSWRKSCVNMENHCMQWK